MSDYWSENGISRPKEIIVCAANKMKCGVVLCGARHWDSTMVQQFRAMNIDTRIHEQGFINQFGEFRTRREAMRIVKENGQPFNVERNGCEKELFSEGLY